MPDLLLHERTAFVRGATRRVLTPRNPPERLFACELRNGDKIVVADAGGFRCLALAASVAATSPHHLVYVPSGTHTPRASYIPPGRSLDLVFGQPHSGFRPSDWRELRRRLGPPIPTRRNAFVREIDESKEIGWQYGDRDPRQVDLAIHAHTLFVLANGDALASLTPMFEWAMRGLNGDFYDLERYVTLRHGYHRGRQRGKGMEFEAMTCTYWEGSRREAEGSSRS